MKVSNNRTRRRMRIRAKVAGSASRPRLSVFRSLSAISVQLIDDAAGKTLVAVHGSAKKGMTKVEQAQAVGKEIAQKAQQAGIAQIVFDRGGYKYQGRVKALADSIREHGLTF